MKLKDILKTDTDNKGWLRVFKKLGADAEMLKYVNENISKGEGGGEINEYYYKVLNPLEGELAVFANPIEIIRTINQETNKRFTVVVGTSDTEILSYYPLYYFLMEGTVIAFKILDREEYINVGSQHLVLPKGNLHTRLAGFGEEGLEALDTCVQEITKEEYESLITQ